MPRTYYLLMLLLSLVWGGSFFFIKLLLPDFQPWTIAFLRSSLGVLTLAVIMLALWRIPRLRETPWLALTGVGLFNTAVPWTLIAFSEKMLTSSMASVLNATTPLWTLLVGIVVFKSRSHRNQWLGMAVGFAGLLVLLEIHPLAVTRVDAGAAFGMLAATLCYAVSTHISKRYLDRLSMYEVALGTLVVGMIGSGAMAWWWETPDLTRMFDTGNLLALTGLGVFGTGIAYIILFTLIQQGSPELVSMVTYLIPATAILWGALLLDEPVNGSLLAGLALILAGVYLAGREPKKRPAAAERDAVQG